MSTSEHWRQRLYERYVTSGQAGISPGETAREGDCGLDWSSVATFVLETIPKDRSIRILDLACGHGRLMRQLSRAGYHNLTGVDVSAEQVAAAHRLGAQQVERSSIEHFLSRTESASADVVLLIDILEHFTEDELFATLEGVRRVLRIGGTCIAHVPNAEGLYGMRVRYGDLTHQCAFTPRSVAQLFNLLGFTAVRCREDKPVVHGAKSLLRRVIWDLGTIPHRLLLTAETGIARGLVLTQNMHVTAVK